MHFFTACVLLGSFLKANNGNRTLNISHCRRISDFVLYAQLETEGTRKMRLYFCSSTDQSSVSEILLYVRRVTQWRYLGLNLGLYPDTLEKIDEHRRGKVDNIMIDVITYWIQGIDGVEKRGGATIKNLVSALQNMDENVIAKNIITAFKEHRQNHDQEEDGFVIVTSPEENEDCETSSEVVTN